MIPLMGVQNFEPLRIHTFCKYIRYKTYLLSNFADYYGYNEKWFYMTVRFV